MPASPLVKRLITTLVYDYSDRFAEGQVVATFHDSYALLAKAAAFARHYGQTHVHIRNGGSEPGERIQPEVSTP